MGYIVDIYGGVFTPESNFSSPFSRNVSRYKNIILTKNERVMSFECYKCIWTTIVQSLIIFCSDCWFVLIIVISAPRHSLLDIGFP